MEPEEFQIILLGIDIQVMKQARAGIESWAFSLDIQEKTSGNTGGFAPSICLCVHPRIPPQESLFLRFHIRCRLLQGRWPTTKL